MDCGLCGTSAAWRVTGSWLSVPAGARADLPVLDSLAAMSDETILTIRVAITVIAAVIAIAVAVIFGREDDRDD